MESFKNITEAAKMTRQHYQLVADVIASLDVNVSIKKEVANAFADAFEPTNKLFNREKFIKATRQATFINVRSLSKQLK